MPNSTLREITALQQNIMKIIYACYSISQLKILCQFIIYNLENFWQLMLLIRS